MRSTVYFKEVPMRTSNDLGLSIDGMSCGHCVASVKRALATVAGVSDATVSIGAARLVIGADAPEKVAAEVIRAIRDAGYDAALSPLGPTSTALSPRA
jgi:Cu+-exporting ATPase